MIKTRFYIFQQVRLNKHFVAQPSAMASAIVAMIAANRLLTPSFVSRKDSGGNPSPELSDVLSWPKERVKKWIQEECRLSSEVAAKAFEEGVDGVTLVELDTAAWEELGVKSAVARARLLGKVRARVISGPDTSTRAGAAEETRWTEVRDDIGRGFGGASRAASSFNPGSASGVGLPRSVVLREGPTLEARSAEAWHAKFAKWCMDKKNWAIGAEHRLYWTKCVSAANGADGHALKEHFLRFLGMYNVMGLLNLTITAPFLLDSEQPTESIDIAIFWIMGFSFLCSSLGIILSTIMYNTASVVHEKNFPLFGKTTAAALCAGRVNDLMFLGFFLFVWAMVIFFCKMGLPGIAYTTGQEHDPPLSKTIWFLLLLPVFMYMSEKKMQISVVLATHMAVFAGLMHSTPIAPEKAGDPAAWQLRATQEEADAFVHDVMYKSMCPDDFADAVVKRYTQAAAGEWEEAEAEAAERIAQISASVGDGGETTALLALAMNRSGEKSRHLSSRVGPLQTVH